MSGNNRARTKTATHISTLRKKFRRARLYTKLVPKVAEQLGLDRSHVYRVLHEQRRSTKVEEVLLREIERIENGDCESAA